MLRSLQLWIWLLFCLLASITNALSTKLPAYPARAIMSHKSFNSSSATILAGANKVNPVLVSDQLDFYQTMTAGS